MIGDLHLPLTTTACNTTTIVLCDIIYDPNGDINLISINNINKPETDWDINLLHSECEGMYHYSHGHYSPTAKIELICAGQLHTLPIGDSDDIFHNPTSFFANC
eukprot:3614860-Rhodomonas_salina.1